MELIADILLVAGAIGAGFYCFVLARRLRRFNDLEKGVGGAVAVLSAQVDDLTQTLQAAQSATGTSNRALDDLTNKAESVAHRLELLMASMHDMPVSEPQIARPTADATPNPGAVKSGVSENVMFVRHDRNEKGVAS
ncbi:MAG: hypothetical protein AAF408_02930 [Pseudomonadota bacterium]